MTDDKAQSSPDLYVRLAIGHCMYKRCQEDAYYDIDFDCDDMTARVCNKHHDKVLALFGLPDCEGE